MISGFRTHSALCIPILADVDDEAWGGPSSGAQERGVVGVLQLLNKFRADGDGEADWEVEPKKQDLADFPWAASEVERGAFDAKNKEERAQMKGQRRRDLRQCVYTERRTHAHALP